MKNGLSFNAPFAKLWENRSKRDQNYINRMIMLQARKSLSDSLRKRDVRNDANEWSTELAGKVIEGRHSLSRLIDFRRPLSNFTTVA